VTEPEKALESLIRHNLPQSGAMIDGNGFFMEAMDPPTRQVWMTLSPGTHKEYADWDPKPEFQKLGCGKSAMDRAAFRHDPTDIQQAIQTKTIDGYTCLQVAIPGEMTPPAEPGLPARISVNKGHTLGFRAGRRVKFMNMDDDHYVETVGDNKADGALGLPPGATFSELKLVSHWVVELPCPTTAFFWFSEHGMRSFQGPVRLPTV